jgi:hypothetical protein
LDPLSDRYRRHTHHIETAWDCKLLALRRFDQVWRSW